MRQSAALVTGAFVLLLVNLSGCTLARVPLAPAATAPSATSEASSSVPVSVPAVDCLRQRKAQVEETSATAKIDRMTALRAAADRWNDDPTAATVSITTTKALLSSEAVHGRLVWIVGANPVSLRDLYAGGPARPIGLAVFVVDAETGDILETVAPPPSR